MQQHGHTQSTESLTIAFNVPTGLEEYALISILHQLRSSIPQTDLDISAPLHSAHVFIRFPTPSVLRDAINTYSSGGLWAVYDAFLCLGIEDLEGVRPVLEEEYWTRHRQIGRKAWEMQKENVAREKALRNAAVLQKGEGAAAEQAEHEQPSESTESKEPALPTPGETQFLASLSALISTSFSSYLPYLPQEPGKKSFRATFSNPSRLLPLTTLHRQGIERFLGEALSTYLKQGDWDVKLLRAEVDVHVRLLPSSVQWTSVKARSEPPAPAPLEEHPMPTPGFPARLLAVLAVALPPAATPQHRLPHLEGSTPLSPPIAHLMGVMHPMLGLCSLPLPLPGSAPSSSGDCGPDDAGKGSKRLSPSAILFDPCSGHGSIPRELLALSSISSQGLQVLAGDISRPSLLSSLASTTSILDGLVYSALYPLPLRPGVIGGVVSDLPWGTRHLSPRQLSALYPRLLKHLAVAVEEGGTGVLMSAARATMESALKGCAEIWENRGCREVKVGGRAAWIWVVVRR